MYSTTYSTSDEAVLTSSCAHRVCTRAYNRSTLEADKKKKLWEDAVCSFVKYNGALNVSDLSPFTYCPTPKDAFGHHTMVSPSLLNAQDLLMFIPTRDPQLGPEMYEYIIFDFLQTSPEVRKGWVVCMNTDLHTCAYNSTLPLPTGGLQYSEAAMASRYL